MLTRRNGTRKLMNSSNNGRTISNVSSINMNGATKLANSGSNEIVFASFIGKTLLPIEKMETYMIDESDMASLRNGLVTDKMVNRIKLIPNTIHAGSLMNKLRKTNKYTLSKRMVFKVVLIKNENYTNHGSKSNAFALIGIIDRNSEIMNALLPNEVEFVNTIYSMNKTIPLNRIKNNGAASNSSATGIVPAVGNILSGLLSGGRRMRSRKTAKKPKKTASRRRRTARKH
jgi:hypothetical protein